jgi:hypothetical protein
MSFAAFKTVAHVRTSDGAVCASAWRAAHREGLTGGERSQQQREADLSACELPAERALHQARTATGAAVLLGVLSTVIVMRERARPRRG